MKAGHRRRWRALIGFLALVSLVAASTMSTAQHLDPETHGAGQFGMSHGGHAGIMPMATIHHEGVNRPTPCGKKDGDGNPNCCIGIICPMTLAALGPAYVVSAVFRISPPSFVWPPVSHLTESSRAGIFRPPIRTV